METEGKRKQESGQQRAKHIHRAQAKVDPDCTPTTPLRAHRLSPSPVFFRLYVRPPVSPVARSAGVLLLLNHRRFKLLLTERKKERESGENVYGTICLRRERAEKGRMGRKRRERGARRQRRGRRTDVQHSPRLSHHHHHLQKNMFGPAQGTNRPFSLPLMSHDFVFRLSDPDSRTYSHRERICYRECLLDLRTNRSGSFCSASACSVLLLHAFHHSV